MAAPNLDMHEQPAVELCAYHDNFRFQVIGLWTDVFTNANLKVFVRDIDIAMARKPNLFCLAISGDKLVGTCLGACDGYRSWVYYLCVALKFRRQGIGTALLHSVEAQLRGEGNLQVGLHARKGNMAALDFYRQSGYFLEEAICMGKRIKD